MILDRDGSMLGHELVPHAPSQVVLWPASFVLDRLLNTAVALLYLQRLNWQIRIE